MEKELDRSKEQILLLKELGESANLGIPLDDVLDKAASGLARIFGYQACDLSLLEKPGILRYAATSVDPKIIRTVEKVTGVTVKDFRIPLFEGSFFKEVLDKGKPIEKDDMVAVMEDFTDNPALRRFAPGVAKLLGYKRALRVPLITEGGAIGVLGIASSKPFSNDDKETLLLFASHIALIVERWNYYQALKSSEQRFTDVTLNTGDWIWETDSTGRYTYSSQLVRDILGYEPEEVIGRFYHEFLLPEDREDLKEKIQEVFRLNKSFSKVINKKVRKDGRTVICETSGTPIIEDGTLIGYRGSVRDITVEREMEDRLRESELKYRSLIENSHSGTYIIQEGVFRFANQRLCEITGYTRDELMGMDFTQLIAPESREIIKGSMKRQKGESGPANFQFTGVKKSGEKRIAYVFSTPILFQGHPAVQGNLFDITDLKDTEERLKKAHAELKIAYRELKEVDRMKKDFLASVSHELRTPLNSIIGFTGILLKGLAGPLNEEQDKQLGLIHSNSLHLLRLIEDLLDISKIEAGKLDINPLYFDADVVLMEVIESLSGSAQDKGLALKSYIQKKRIYSDPTRFRQIIFNLIGNGIKFTKKGFVEVRSIMLEDSYLISVKDTGIGIEKADIERLFKPFVHLPLPTDMVRDGTGLGLYLSKEVSKLLNSELWAESTPGKGSTFYFKISCSGEGEG